MITLAFDTETTGLPSKEGWKIPTHESWPDTLQFGMVVLENRYPIFELGCLLDNPVMPIEQGAFEVHGISGDMCAAWGVPKDDFINQMTMWMGRADRLVAHNAGFDRNVIGALLRRRNSGVNPFADKSIICTMQSSMAICKIPGKFGSYKWPSLAEAYRILVNKDGFRDAHNALADVWACIEILWKLEAGGVNLVGPR